MFFFFLHNVEQITKVVENDDINLEVYILIEKMQWKKKSKAIGMEWGAVKVFSENKFSLSEADYRNALFFEMILLFSTFSGGWMVSGGEEGRQKRKTKIDRR